MHEREPHMPARPGPDGLPPAARLGDSMPVRSAIIGCGIIGPTHATALALDGRAALAWCCDPIPARAQSLASQHGAHATSDVQQVLADPTITLVSICTPHQTHADLACAAIAAGKHVLIEKPLATTPGDIDRILTAARSSRQIVSGIYQHRYAPVVQRLQGLVAQGAFGWIRSAAVDFRCTRDAAYYASGPWRGTWDGEGGALLINQAIHTIDLLTVLLGEPCAVTANLARRRQVTREGEDWADLAVTYAFHGHRSERVPATIHAVNDGVTPWHARVALVGDTGRFTLDETERFTELQHPSSALVAELQALAAVAPAMPSGAKECYGSLHASQLSDVVTAITTGTEPLVTAAAAAVTNRLVLAAYTSAATGSPCRVDQPSGDFARPTLSPACKLANSTSK